MMDLYTRKESKIVYSESVSIPYKYCRQLFETYLGGGDYDVNENATYWAIDRIAFKEMCNNIAYEIDHNELRDIRIYHNMEPRDVLSALLYLYAERDKDIDVIILEYF